MTEMTIISNRWAQNIAAPGRVLAGSQLTGPEAITGGVRYTIHLAPGWQTLSTAINLGACV